MQKELDALVREVLPLDRSAMTAAEEYQARLAKPPGSLGRLEEISIQLAGITGHVHNALNKKQLLVFAADNGVVAEGVSSAPQSVTKQQTINLMRGKTGAAVLAKHFGCGLTVCDVGVNADIYESAVLNRKIAYGTQNICTGPAMTREQTLQAILTGAEIARTVDADVIGVGEMGIGNTTTSSAVLAVLLVLDLAVLAIGVACGAGGVGLIATAFIGLPMVADMLILLGGGAAVIAIALVVIWLAIWLFIRMVIGWVRLLVRLGKRWCRKEIAA